MRLTAPTASKEEPVRRLHQILGALALLVIAAPVATPKQKPAKDSGQSSILIVFKDGRQQSYPLADISRIEFNSPTSSVFGEEVAFFLGVGSDDATLQTDAHEIKSFRILDDLNRPALKHVDDALRFDVILRREWKEHELLEAKVAAHLFRVTASLNRVSELPWSENNSTIGKLQLLEPVQTELAPELGRFSGAGFQCPLDGFSGPDFIGLGSCFLLSQLERFVFSGVRQQEIEDSNCTDRE